MITPRTAVALIAPVLLPACASTAPYTGAAAAINTGLALGAAAGQRAAGGCYATCVHGMVCNPGTGFCETSLCGTCPEGESCVLVNGGWRCGTVGEASRAGASVRTDVLLPGLGVSPQTGGGPPQPFHPGPDQP